MSSPILHCTFQAVTPSAASNVLAQGLVAYRQQSPAIIGVIQFLRFVLFSLFVTPPNYTFQKFLEYQFPTTIRDVRDEQVPKRNESVDLKREGKLSITNSAIKFVLDQSLGASVNTLLFISVMGVFKGLPVSDILTNVHQDFWPMLSVGYRVWPMVCLLNLVVVPFEHHMLVGNTAAFGMGIYMSLRSL